jgi:serine/threonine protein kinase
VSHGTDDESSDATLHREELTRARPAPGQDDRTFMRPPSDDKTLARPRPEGETRVRARAPNDDRPGARVSEDTATSAVSFGVGYVLRDRYRLIESIGQGAMGQVWKARDTYIEKGRNQLVAIKVFRSDFQNHPRALEAMQAEASRAMQLPHPNIATVHIFDLDPVSGRPFIVMELLEGQPLDQVIRSTDGRGLPPEKAWPIIKGMSEGLAYAHRKGLVHSDLKPANVFLTNDGVAKVLDFGIARAVRQPGNSQAGEDENILSGYTTMYAAPEVLEEQEADTADDVFALGLVTYELLTSRHPFNRIPATEIRARKLQPQPIKGLKRREWHVLQKSLALTRRERFADAGEFLRALQGLTLLQSSLIAAVIILTLAAGGMGYRAYLESRPAVDFKDLPLRDQQTITAQLALGQEALRLIEEQHIIDTAEDAAAAFAKAYSLHPRDPDAVAGLNSTAEAVIGWADTQPDKKTAATVLETLRLQADYYNNYEPLTRAIRRAKSN